jgi:hypothetical protein
MIKTRKHNARKYIVKKDLLFIIVFVLIIAIAGFFGDMLEEDVNFQVSSLSNDEISLQDKTNKNSLFEIGYGKNMDNLLDQFRGKFSDLDIKLLIGFEKFNI